MLAQIEYLRIHARVLYIVYLALHRALVVQNGVNVAIKARRRNIKAAFTSRKQHSSHFVRSSIPQTWCGLVLWAQKVLHLVQGCLKRAILFSKGIASSAQLWAFSWA